MKSILYSVLQCTLYSVHDQEYIIDLELGNKSFKIHIYNVYKSLKKSVHMNEKHAYIYGWFFSFRDLKWFCTFYILYKMITGNQKISIQKTNFFQNSSKEFSIALKMKFKFYFWIFRYIIKINVYLEFLCLCCV